MHGMQAKEPKHLPWSIMGALAVCCLLYVLMALAICLIQPVAAIDTGAPFSAAFLALIPAGASPKGFQRVFLTVSARFISFGAVTGTLHHTATDVKCAPAPTCTLCAARR